MRKRIGVLCAALALALGTIIAAAPNADARQIRLIGCDSLLNWPCPGPVP